MGQMEEENAPPWATKPEEIPKKTIGKNGNLLNVGGTYEGGGRPKGSKNRATILKQFMKLRLTKQISLSGETRELPLESHMELEMIAAILEDRDVQAYKEIKDTLYGKNTDNLNLTGDVDLSHAIQLKIEFEKPDTEQKPDEP